MGQTAMHYAAYNEGDILQLKFRKTSWITWNVAPLAPCLSRRRNEIKELLTEQSMTMYIPSQFLVYPWDPSLYRRSGVIQRESYYFVDFLLFVYMSFSIINKTIYLIKKEVKDWDGSGGGDKISIAGWDGHKYQFSGTGMIIRKLVNPRKVVNLLPDKLNRWSVYNHELLNCINISTVKLPTRIPYFGSYEAVRPKK